VHPLWLDNIESLEAISQNEDARRIFLRMASLAQTGRTPSFVMEVALDRELDPATKGRLVELAQDESFLLAVEEYLIRTHRLH
jgi:replicative DNA helicase